MEVYTPPKVFFNAQNRQIDILNRIYKNYAINTEYDLSAKKISDEIGYPKQQVGNLIKLLDDQKIISRRMTAEGEPGTSSFHKVTYMTIKVNHEMALRRLKNWHMQELQSLSLKHRILSILASGRVFSTTKELGDQLQIFGGSTDFHNLTHALHVLKREHKVEFETGNTKDKIPYNIKLTKLATKKSNGVAPAQIEEKEEEVVEVKPQPPVAYRHAFETDDNKLYPTVVRLYHRKEWLEAAAKLAEGSEAEDIAIMLQDRASKPLTKLEEEAIKLYEFYVACKESNSQ